MLTASIPIAYIGKQLGHRAVTTTATHYAKWYESDGIYRDPMRLHAGEVPADLLARFGVVRSEARYSEEGRSQPLREAA